MRFFVFVLVAVSIFNLSCQEQKEEVLEEGIVGIDSIYHPMSDSLVRIEDSMKVSALVMDFYNWYIYSAQNSKTLEFNPSFEKDSLGYTTLYFKKYTKNLYDHHFTDAHVQRVIDRYNPCLENLKNVKYDSLKAFDDLGQFEEINCDFENVYDWTGGQEMIDGIEIFNFKVFTDQSAVVQIRFYNNNFYNNNLDNYKRSYVSNTYSTEVYCIKENEKWKIDNIVFSK